MNENVYIDEISFEPNDQEIVENIEPAMIGVVSDCKKLNVREAPSKSAEVVAKIVVGTELMIEKEESTPDWYKVWTPSGIEGFCMRQFVKIM